MGGLWQVRALLLMFPVLHILCKTADEHGHQPKDKNRGTEHGYRMFQYGFTESDENKQRNNDANWRQEDFKAFCHCLPLIRLNRF